MSTKPHPFPVGLEIHEISRSLRRTFDAKARGFGFTQEQWRALWHLSRNEGISQTKLADILEMQPISVGRLIDRLEAAGLVERRPHPTDRRAVKLYLTATAQPQLAQLRVRAAELNDAALRGLSASEQESLLALLQRVRQNIETSEDAEPTANAASAARVS